MPETVSVLICTYNYARFLPECLASVLRQTRPPDEIIVADDGSTDQTPEVMKRFPQVRYIRQKNQGKAAAFNRAFQIATGEIVCHLDADDSWEPNKLECVLPYFTADSTLGGVVHEVHAMDGQGHHLDVPWALDHPAEPTVLTLDESEDVGFLYPLPHACGRWFGVPNTSCVRRGAIEDLLPLPDRVGLSVDGICVAGALRRRILYLPEALANYRIHAKNSAFGNPGATRDTTRMWQFLLENQNFRRHLSPKHASLLRAKILEREGYLASRTGQDIFRAAWASVRVPLILLTNGYLCNWRHLALPIICLLPVKRARASGSSPDAAKHSAALPPLGS